MSTDGEWTNPYARRVPNLAGPSAAEYRKRLSEEELLILQAQGGELTPEERRRLGNWQRAERLAGKRQDRTKARKYVKPASPPIRWVPPKAYLAEPITDQSAGPRGPAHLAAPGAAGTIQPVCPAPHPANPRRTARAGEGAA